MKKSWLLSILLAWLSPYVVAQERAVITPLERGLIRNDQRVGIWEYYKTPTRVDLRIDYDNGRLLYIEPDTSDFVVQGPNGWIKQKLEIPCRPHGPKQYLYDHYRRYFWDSKLIEKARKEKKNYDVLLTFEVHPDGVAQNPQIVNDPGFNVKDQLLKLFEAAMPTWIVGVTPDGNAVVCRMAIRYVLCLSDCEKLSPVKDATVIAAYIASTETQASPRSYAFRTMEQQGLQFSPSGNRVLVDLSTSYKDQKSAISMPLIIDMEGNVLDRIEFGTVNGSWWVSENQILFKYDYPGSWSLMGMKDLASGHVSALSDSSIFGIQFSPDQSQVVLSHIDNNDQVDVWLHDFKTGHSQILINNESDPTVARDWSRDGQFLVMEKRNVEGIDSYYFLKLSDLSQIPIPVLDGAPCGWSPDNKTLFMARDKLGDYEVLGNIYAISRETGRMTQVREKLKGLYQVQSHPTENAVTLNIKNKVYTLGLEPEAKPVLLFENSRLFRWKEDGSGIVYENTNFEIWFWSKTTGAHKQLFFREEMDSGKKKKKK